MAVLKFSWSDTVYTGDTPNGLIYSDAVINRLFFPLSTSWWGVAQYWRHTSYGIINLEGTQVFPWRKLTGFPAPTMPGVLYTRFQLINQAVTQAKAEGWPLDDFKGIVLWVAPLTAISQDAGSDANRIDGKWPYCVLFENSVHDFCAHEFGHALGFEHIWGPPAGGGAVLPYQSPYCVMAARTYRSTLPMFAIPADPNGPPAGDQYWTSLAPMPAAATLYKHVAEFAASHHVTKVGIITAGWQRSVTLRARDLTQGPHPVLAVAEAGPGVVGGRVAYLVELRRSVDWDRGLESPAIWASPPTGVVVHSLQNLTEYAGLTVDLDTKPKVVFEGSLPLPLTSGDADWRSTGGDFVVRVVAAASDLSWVELQLGGADLAGAGAVTVGVVMGGSINLVEEGDARDVPVFVCGKGNYHFFIDHQHTEIRCTATAFGYDTPRFNWKVNGVDVPAPGSGSFGVPVLATFPRPTSETKESRTAVFQYVRATNTLVLTADPAHGNYTLEIEALVTENNSAVSSTPPASGTAFEKVETIIVSWEKRYYDDLEACIKRVRDLNDKYARSRKLPTLNPGDPFTRVQVVLHGLQESLRVANPRISQQIDAVMAVYSQAGKRRG
jgi:hypothetical protein